MLRKPLAKIAGGLILGLSTFTSAVADQPMVTLKVTVVVPPPCTINSNQIINVVFNNNILTTHIDGRQYLQEFNPNIVCNNLYKDQLRFKIDGIKSAFDNSALKVTNDFAISILADNKPITLGSWQNFTATHIPTFAVVPVKRANAQLAGQGRFTASATLTIDYQ